MHEENVWEIIGAKLFLKNFSTIFDFIFRIFFRIIFVYILFIKVEISFQKNERFKKYLIIYNVKILLLNVYVYVDFFLKSIA